MNTILTNIITLSQRREHQILKKIYSRRRWAGDSSVLYRWGASRAQSHPPFSVVNASMIVVFYDEWWVLCARAAAGSDDRSR